jgi:hypothetical protein
MSNLSKRLVLIIILIILIGAGIWFCVCQRKVVEGTDKSQGLQRLFPEKIGEYTLVKQDTKEKLYNGIQVENSCTPANSEGRTAPEICDTTVSGKYEKNNSNDIVYVHIQFFPKGLTWQKADLLKQSMQQTIGSYHDARRIADFSIFWYPISGVNIVETREAAYDPNDMSATPRYSGQTGQNSVTQFFLNEYPPAE